MTTAVELFDIKGSKLKQFTDKVSDKVVYEVAYQPSLGNDIFIKYIGFVEVKIDNIMDKLKEMS